MTFETIEYRQDGCAAVITFNRPRVHNAMNTACLIESKAALALAAEDPEVRVVIFTGAGDRAFTAGADIGEIESKSPFEMLAYNRRWLDLFSTVEGLRKPVIASVHGWATGGGTELSLACDFVLCSEEARFGLQEINIGVIPGAGAAVRLTRWMGRARAKEVLMLGQFIPGEEAVRIGLANRCVRRDALWATTMEWADRLGAKPPLALAAAKASVNVGGEMALPLGLEYELREFLLLFATEDQREGMRAFLDKRPPVFRGR